MRLKRDMERLEKNKKNKIEKENAAILRAEATTKKVQEKKEKARLKEQMKQKHLLKRCDKFETYMKKMGVTER